MVTLKDIAAVTGISVNSVCRALRDMPDIGAATKQRVREKAKEMGYTPNFMARALVLKRSFTIGILVSESNNPARSILIQQLRRIAMSGGYHLLVAAYDSEPEVAGYIRDMMARAVDGLIIGNVNGVLEDKPFYSAIEEATQADVPVVLFFNSLTEMVDHVSVDYSVFTEKLTRHLIEEHGLKRIHFVGESIDCPRGTGYRRAMQVAGLEDHSKIMPFNYWSCAETRKGIIGYLKNQRPPEGIVCHNDLAAIGVIAGLREMGLRVPEDVAVAGIDNIELADYFQPKLTTVGLDPSNVAEALFSLLWSRIDGEYSGEMRQVKLEHKTFFRESCGCGQAHPVIAPRNKVNGAKKAKIPVENPEALRGSGDVPAVAIPKQNSPRSARSKTKPSLEDQAQWS